MNFNDLSQFDCPKLEEILFFCRYNSGKGIYKNKPIITSKKYSTNQIYVLPTLENGQPDYREKAIIVNYEEITFDELYKTLNNKSREELTYLEDVIQVEIIKREPKSYQSPS